VYISDDFATDNRRLAGAEIISINGVPAATIVQTLMTDTPGDGNILTGKAFHIGGGGGLGYFRALFSPMLSPLLGITNPFTLRYQLPGQRQIQTIQVTGQPFADLVKAYETRHPTEARPPLLPDGQIMPHPQPQFYDNGTIAYWQVDGFGGYTPADRNGAFIDTAFQQIHTFGSKTLILDVRGNGGGLDALGARLFSYFADGPFQYYDDLVTNTLNFGLSHTKDGTQPPADQFARSADGKYHWVQHPNWGILQPHTPHFGGKVYLLIDGACFSTCGEFVSTMQYHRKATFIGEEIGGGYYGNTSGFSYAFYLPHTKIVLDLPVVAYYLSVHGYAQADQGVMPDYPVQPTVTDLLTGKDPALAMALSLARGACPQQC
jgi:hypothetical protein